MSSDALGDAAKDEAVSRKWMDLPEHRKRLASMVFYEALLTGGGAFPVVDIWDQETSRGIVKILHVELSIGEFVLAIPTWIDGIFALVDFELSEQGLDLAGKPSTPVC